MFFWIATYCSITSIVLKEHNFNVLNTPKYMRTFYANLYKNDFFCLQNGVYMRVFQ